MKRLGLSQNEKIVAGLIAQGYKDVEISKKLFVSQRRVGEIIFNIKEKWGIRSRVELGIIAYQSNLIEGTRDKINN